MINQSKKFNSFKVIAATAAIAVLMPLASAQAAERHSGRDRFNVYAKVISAVPIYRRVELREPIEKCWTEHERYVINEGHSYGHSHRRHKRHYNSNRTDNTIVGGVIGGVIGNQIGRNTKGGARIGATIAGAIIGSAIGNEVSGNHSHRRHGRYNSHSNYYSPTYGVRPVQRCKTVVHNRYEQRIEGYNVTYIHRGRRFKTRTRRDPGARIKLNVHTRPARGR